MIAQKHSYPSEESTVLKRKRSAEPFTPLKIRRRDSPEPLNETDDAQSQGLIIIDMDEQDQEPYCQQTEVDFDASAMWDKGDIMEGKEVVHDEDQLDEMRRYIVSNQDTFSNRWNEFEQVEEESEDVDPIVFESFV
jgi:hypothetical protein